MASQDALAHEPTNEDLEANTWQNPLALMQPQHVDARLDAAEKVYTKLTAQEAEVYLEFPEATVLKVDGDAKSNFHSIELAQSLNVFESFTVIYFKENTDYAVIGGVEILSGCLQYFLIRKPEAYSVQLSRIVETHGERTKQLAKQHRAWRRKQWWSDCDVELLIATTLIVTGFLLFYFLS